MSWNPVTANLSFYFSIFLVTPWFSVVYLGSWSSKIYKSVEKPCQKWAYKWNTAAPAGVSRVKGGLKEVRRASLLCHWNKTPLNQMYPPPRFFPPSSKMVMFTLKHLYCTVAVERLSALPPGRQVPIKALIYGAWRIPFQEAVLLKYERGRESEGLRAHHEAGRGPYI